MAGLGIYTRVRFSVPAVLNEAGAEAGPSEAGRGLNANAKIGCILAGCRATHHFAVPSQSDRGSCCARSSPSFPDNFMKDQVEGQVERSGSSSMSS